MQDKNTTPIKVGANITAKRLNSQFFPIVKLLHLQTSTSLQIPLIEHTCGLFAKKLKQLAN
jgi:hypothetical protein